MGGLTEARSKGSGATYVALLQTGYRSRPMAARPPPLDHPSGYKTRQHPRSLNQHRGLPLPGHQASDFGLSHYQRDETDRGKYGPGTYTYQPPEPHYSTNALDVWAIGAVVHSLAYGIPPCAELHFDSEIERRRRVAKQQASGW
jgi:hypothetical protein